MVLGDDDEQPTPPQLEQMKALVRDAMHDGAVGVSTSLEYAPAPYAKTEEIIALAERGGEIWRHLRHPYAGESDAFSRRSTKPSASDAKPTFPSKSGT